MLQYIFSELTSKDTYYIPWHIAQRLSEIILNRVELEGMLPPYYEKQEEKDLTIKSTTSELAHFYKWESES